MRLGEAERQRSARRGAAAYVDLRLWLLRAAVLIALATCAFVLLSQTARADSGGLEYATAVHDATGASDEARSAGSAADGQDTRVAATEHEDSDEADPPKGEVSPPKDESTAPRDETSPPKDESTAPKDETTPPKDETNPPKEGGTEQPTDPQPPGGGGSCGSAVVPSDPGEVVPLVTIACGPVDPTPPPPEQGPVPPSPVPPPAPLPPTPGSPSSPASPSAPVVVPVTGGTSPVSVAPTPAAPVDEPGPASARAHIAHQPRLPLPAQTASASTLGMLSAGATAGTAGRSASDTWASGSAASDATAASTAAPGHARAALVAHPLNDSASTPDGLLAGGSTHSTSVVAGTSGSVTCGGASASVLGLLESVFGLGGDRGGDLGPLANVGDFAWRLPRQPGFAPD